MADYQELWAGGPVFAQAGHFKLGTDSVLLADFVPASGLRAGIDLGCASGAILLLLLARTERLHMTGLELDPDAVQLAQENLAHNSLETRGSILAGDIRRCRELLPAGGFDLAVANPPYFPVGSGIPSPDPARAAARDERTCTLNDLCAAAEYLLRTGGSFCVVHKPERLSELFCTMAAHRIEPKRLRAVCPRKGSAPNLVLVEGRRGGNPGLRFEPELVLANDDGSETGEIRRIYHHDF